MSATPATPKSPRRLSAVPIEETKPSKIIAAFWWIVFIVPIIFLYFGTGNLFLIALLIFLRIILLIYQRGKESKIKKKAPPLKTAAPVPEEEIPAPVMPQRSGNKYMSFKAIFTPLILEAKDEWRGLMKFLRIYDHDWEDRYLDDYRKIRGWK